MGLLDGRVAIVTGAGHGIGRGHALELAKEGAKVLVNDLGTSLKGEGTGKDADLTVDLIRERGGEAAANYENVADFAGAGRMVATGGRRVRPARHPGEQRRHRSRRDDLEHDRGGLGRGDQRAPQGHVSHPRTTRPCTGARCNKAGEDVSTGRIINTTSGAGLVGNFGQANYTTAKAGIAAFTMTVSLELYRMGVTCNAIGPAGATRMAASIPGAGIEAKEPDEFDEWNPMDPSLSSPIVAWLASDQASHVTGQVIRAVRDEIVHMVPWSNGKTVSKPGQRWEAGELGAAINTDIFGSRAPGLRY